MKHVEKAAANAVPGYARPKRRRNKPRRQSSYQSSRPRDSRSDPTSPSHQPNEHQEQTSRRSGTRRSQNSRPSTAPDNTGVAPHPRPPPRPRRQDSPEGTAISRVTGPRIRDDGHTVREEVGEWPLSAHENPGSEQAASSRRNDGSRRGDDGNVRSPTHDLDEPPPATGQGDDRADREASPGVGTRDEHEAGPSGPGVARGEKSQNNGWRPVPPFEEEDRRPRQWRQRSSREDKKPDT